MIARAREAAGFDVRQLADRIGQSDTTVRRLEAEETEPSVKQINALVAALPISAEALLKAMGVHLSLPLAATLPRELVESFPQLSPDARQALTVLTALAATGASSAASHWPRDWPKPGCCSHHGMWLRSAQLQPPPPENRPRTSLTRTATRALVSASNGSSPARNQPDHNCQRPSEFPESPCASGL